MFIAGFSGCALATVISLLVLYPYYPQALVEARFAIFARLADDISDFDSPPAKLFDDKFLRDDQKIVDCWRNYARTRLAQLSDLPSDFEQLPTIERAKTLARRNTGGGEWRRFADYETLIDRFRDVRNGAGYCSDLSETFLALCSMNGIDAYEFSLARHTIAGFYCPETGRWVAVDPQYCLLFKNDAGEYLSPVGLRSTGLSGATVHFESFWDETRGALPTEPFIPDGCYDGRAAYRDFVFTAGNNVFSVDRVRRYLRWVPKPVRQLYYRAIGVMPEYRIVLDPYSRRAHSLPALRVVVWGGGALLLALMLPQLALSTYRFFTTRRRPAPSGAPVDESELSRAA